MCQKSQDNQNIYDCGDQDNVQFSYDDSTGLVLKYSHTEAGTTKYAYELLLTQLSLFNLVFF